MSCLRFLAASIATSDYLIISGIPDITFLSTTLVIVEAIVEVTVMVTAFCASGGASPLGTLTTSHVSSDHNRLLVTTVVYSVGLPVFPAIVGIFAALACYNLLFSVFGFIMPACAREWLVKTGAIVDYSSGSWSDHVARCRAEARFSDLRGGKPGVVTVACFLECWVGRYRGDLILKVVGKLGAYGGRSRAPLTEIREVRVKLDGRKASRIFFRDEEGMRSRYRYSSALWPR